MSGALLTDETGDRKDGKKTSHVGKQYRGGLGNDRQRVVSVSFLWADERLLLPDGCYYPLEVEPYTPAHHFQGAKPTPLSAPSPR